MKNFNHELKNGLVWLPELGMGRYPVPAQRPYNADYFSRYRDMAHTPMGHALTEARISLIARHYSGPVVDVGIGSGQFVETRPDTRGFDVNPAGIEWLKSRGLWSDIYLDSFPALTFWDALEHIDRPDVAVSAAQEWCFVSIPIFKNAEDILQSRHFRKDEHIFYFTDAGLQLWFAEQGFKLVEKNTIESDLGRDGISSYAFNRI